MAPSCLQTDEQQRSSEWHGVKRTNEERAYRGEGPRFWNVEVAEVGEAETEEPDLERHSGV